MNYSTLTILLILTHVAPLCAIENQDAELAPTYENLESGKREKALWRTTIGTLCGRPAVGRGKVILGTNNARPRDQSIRGYRGVVMCFDSRNGQFLWQMTHRGLPRRMNDIGLGVQSQPFIDGNRVFYVSNRGELVCLDIDGFRDKENDGPFLGETRTKLSDADIIWSLDMVGELGVMKIDALDVQNPICSPIVVDDLVYCVTGNGGSYERSSPWRVYRPEAPSFIAVDKSNGKIVWSSNAPGENIMYGQWSSPTYARISGVSQIVFGGGDGCLYGFEPLKGKLLWSVDCTNSRSVQWLRKRRKIKDFFVAAPEVANDTAIVALNQDLEQGPVNQERKIYAYDLSGVVEGKRPSLKWTFGPDEQLADGTYGSPVVSQGIVFVLSRMGYLFAMDAGTGRELWRHELFLYAPPFTGPYVHQGCVYVPTAEELYVFKISRKKKILQCYDFGDLIHTAPTVCPNGKRLFIATNPHLWALKLP